MTTDPWSVRVMDRSYERSVAREERRTRLVRRSLLALTLLQLLAGSAYADMISEYRFHLMGPFL